MKSLEHKVSSPAVDLNTVISLDDFQRHAKQVLGSVLYQYVASGTDDEQTLAENRAGFKRFFLVPRMMRDVSGLDASCTVYGCRLSMPVFVSPAGVHKLMHLEGEVATARACAKAGVLMGVSQHATVSLEEVAAAAPGAPRWFQMYILKDRELTANIVRRAEASGYSAIVITVDSVRFGSREADWRNGFSGLPAGLSLPNYPTQASYNDRVKTAWDQNTEKLFDDRATWADVGWVKGITRLPVLVKGVLSPLDAGEATLAGADGIVVSNHGGRQLDGCLSSIESLGPIVKAVRALPGRSALPIFLDGGVRRGTDVMKALALGATAVLLGKPVYFALAVGGQAGVRRMLELMQQEFEACMALCGCKTVEDISQDLVVHRPGGTVYIRAAL